MAHGTKNARNAIIVLATSYFFSPENPEKVNAHDSQKRDQAQTHPNVKFIIILTTNEKKCLSNLFIIFPRFLKCRFIVIIFTAVVFDIYISQFISIYNSY